MIDFGIRGIDLTYALMDGYDAVILVDAAQRGEAPGVVSVVEPDLIEAEDSTPEELALSPHELDPAKVLRLASALGGNCRRVLLVACEPLTLRRRRRRHGFERACHGGGGCRRGDGRRADRWNDGGVT